MQRKPNVGSPLSGSEDEADGTGSRPARLMPPCRRLFFLILVFLYVPVAYAYGVKLLAGLC